MSDLGPAQIEGKMRDLVNALALAQKDLARIRDEEVAAKHKWEAARRQAWHDPDCPKPTRGGFTVADRDEWIAARVVTEQHVYDYCVSKREAATDHLRTLRDQAVLVSALSKSVQASMSFAGVGER